MAKKRSAKQYVPPAEEELPKALTDHHGFPDQWSFRRSEEDISHSYDGRKIYDVLTDASGKEFELHYFIDGSGFTGDYKCKCHEWECRQSIDW